MKFATVLALAATAFAAPVEKRQSTIDDVTILQYALTLEHLENVFYKGAVSKWSQEEFVAANFSAAYYNNLKYITHDEESHVVLLEGALKAAGATPVAACTYKFPYTTVASFVGLASILEGVGVSAYLGAAPSVASKAYLTVAGSILSTEAIHTAIQRLAVGEVGPASPYATPLDFNEVYTLAAQFITACPSSNPALPFKPFPAFTAVQGQPTAPGISFLYSVAPGSVSGSGLFVTYVSGLNVESVPATVDSTGKVTSSIGMTAMGQSYALLTNANVTGGALNDSMILAGPAILEVTPNSPTFDVTIL